MKEIDADIENRKRAAIRQAKPFLDKQAAGERSDDVAQRKVTQSADYEDIKDAFSDAFNLED